MDENNISYDKVGKSFEISKVRLIGNTSMKINHFHDAYEIYYLLEGERHYFIKDKVYDIKKGDLVFIPINELHKTIDAGVPIHERILITFKKSYLNNILVEAGTYDLLKCFQRSTCVVRLSSDDQSSVEVLLLRMIKEDQGQTNSSSIYIKVMLTELLILSGRLLENSPHHNFQNLNPMHNKMSEIIMYINKNYKDELTLDFISKLFFISTWYLCRTFKKITGLNLNQYINSIRVKEAEKLLLNTKLSITQISEEVGYDSITHFGRVFKTLTGVSPLKYRKMLT